MNTKAKGNKLEWAVMDALRVAGFDHVQRGSASKGVDVIGGRFSDNTKWFISCKWGGYIKPTERADFIKTAEFWNAIPCGTKRNKEKYARFTRWQIISLLDDHKIMLEFVIEK